MPAGYARFLVVVPDYKNVTTQLIIKNRLNFVFRRNDNAI